LTPAPVVSFRAVRKEEPMIQRRIAVLDGAHRVGVWGS
jgi:hypothetical protein